MSAGETRLLNDRPTSSPVPLIGSRFGHGGRDGRKLTGLPRTHARSRRAGPLLRWLMDDAATAVLPARSSLAPWRDARRAPAVQYLSPWAHHLDVPGMRCGGVRATADRWLPDSGWCRAVRLGAYTIPHGRTRVSDVVAAILGSSRGVHDLPEPAANTASELRELRFMVLGVDQSCAIDV